MTFDIERIMELIPHRYPFLLVDRITEFEVDKRIVGVKNVSLNERYLAHRTGERPVLPPTILTEAVAQVGAILILAKPEIQLNTIQLANGKQFSWGTGKSVKGWSSNPPKMLNKQPYR